MMKKRKNMISNGVIKQGNILACIRCSHDKQPLARKCV